MGFSSWRRNFDLKNPNDKKEALQLYAYYWSHILNNHSEEAVKHLEDLAKKAGLKFMQTNNNSDLPQFELVPEAREIVQKLLSGADIRQTILEAVKVSAEEIPLLDVDAIIPDQKDKDRADNLQYNNKRQFHGNGAPWSSEASKMAKLIGDPYKLVRRSKAVVARWGTDDNRGENVWIPFKQKLQQMGFTNDQINIIAHYHG